MTTLPANPGNASAPAPAPATAAAARPRRRRAMAVNLSAYGEPMLWLTGGALAVCVVMIVGLLLLVIRMGLVTFWPSPVVQLTLEDGTVLMGEVTRTDRFQPGEATLASMAPATSCR